MAGHIAGGPRAEYPASTSATDDEDDRWCMAVRLLGCIERELDLQLQRRHGLPLSDYRALCALSRAEAGDTMRMGELAARIGLKDSTVTRLVSRLEAQHLTERHWGGVDGRAVTAALTDAGLQRYSEATSTYRAALGKELEAARHNVHLADLAAWVRDSEEMSGP